MGDLVINMKPVYCFLIATGLCACSSNRVNETVYDALNQRECIIKTGLPNCDSGQPGYDDYNRERNALKNE